MRSGLVLRLMVVGAVCVTLALPSTAQATSGGTLERASIPLAPDTETTKESFTPAISGDGRYVAFVSSATNLVSGDTNSVDDVFVFDSVTNAIERVSVSGAEAQSNAASREVAISGDGQYVVFASLADNLVVGDSNSAWDIFLRDRTAGTTERVSVAASGAQANDSSFYPDITPNGQVISFHSAASNLVTGDGNGTTDVFVRDLSGSTTKLASVATGGAIGNGASNFASINADGTMVAFSSAATNLVTGDTNGLKDVFVRDMTALTTKRVSLRTTGDQAVGGDSSRPVISGNGNIVAFESAAVNLVAADGNGHSDIFVRDVSALVTTLISKSTGGAPGNGISIRADMDDSGRFIMYDSSATDLVTGADANAADRDVFLYDRTLALTTRLSREQDGPQGNKRSLAGALSNDALYASFESLASNLGAPDSNGVPDVYLAQAIPDTDNDGLLDIADNCPFVPNPGQENTVVAVGNGTTFPGDDDTVPNDDQEGDACDSDVDNDGLANGDEDPLAACGPSNGLAAGHPAAAGGDITFDDNANGDAAPLMGSDGGDNGPSHDTDADGRLDGAECDLETNPRSAGSKPTTGACGGLSDADGDGLLAAWETCRWGSSDTSSDSDGDGLGDCREAADVDGDTFVTFPGDVLGIAQIFFGGVGEDGAMDIDGDGLLTFPGDVLRLAAYFFGTSPCA